MQLETFHNYNK